MAKKKAAKRAARKPARAKATRKSAASGDKAPLDPIQAALARRRQALIAR
ncbi:MAG TPA: histone H1 [Myxococcota bacterium]|nr:histone H1 [Myxococcota bacterium]